MEAFHKAELPAEKINSVGAIHESPAQNRTKQKPSLVREGGPLAVDE